VYLNPITVDGTTYNFTEDSLKELIKSEITTKKKHEAISNEAQEAYRKLVSTRSKVYDFFSEAFDDGSDEVTVTRDDVNQLLESIGSDVLTTTWSATVEITVTVTGIKATSPEEVEDYITDNIEVSGYDLELHDPDVRVQDIERE
jgi:acetylornithine deacetylase/succinyl-diaminopimelate desuccinylase-like protein